jgi:hypothetical protein
MPASILHEQMLEEIKRIPEDKLSELYDFIHFFRIGIETTNREQQHPDTEQILTATNGIYGLWRDKEFEVEEYIRELRKDRIV